MPGKILEPAQADAPRLPSFRIEDSLRGHGVQVIAGVDEAGRGPLAGPVVAAAVVLPEGFAVEGINDSKLLSADQRDRLFGVLCEKARVGLGIETPESIDRVNILQATRLAMRAAVSQLTPAPDHVLIDGLPIGDASFAYTALVKGDQRSLSIAAASIVAKVTRDRIMVELDRQFPLYGFASHKGYATRRHLERLREHGPCPAHRRSFAPVQGACTGTLT
ncbi:MAG: ribonuclease HII, partial [Armatimonadetes bacterium]|nr:ribonuclease HII [Armatimonadota bacterium]